MITKEIINNVSSIIVGDFIIQNGMICEIISMKEDSTYTGFQAYTDYFEGHSWYFSNYESIPKNVEIFRFVDYEKQIKERQQAKQMRHLFNYGLRG